MPFPPKLKTLFTFVDYYKFHNFRFDFIRRFSVDDILHFTTHRRIYSSIYLVLRHFNGILITLIVSTLVTQWQYLAEWLKRWRELMLHRIVEFLFLRGDNWCICWVACAANDLSSFVDAHMSLFNGK